MSPMSYYYIYSAMTQVTGALLALVGLFIVFRLQLQRERIRAGYDGLRVLLSPKSVSQGQASGGILWKTRDELDKIAEDMITKKEDEGWKRIEVEYNSLKKHKDILKYTRGRGIGIIFEIGFIFIYYLLILHYNEKILFKRSQNIFFYVGLILCVVVIMRILNFLRRCIAPCKDELLI